jgi:hypothetical protein
MRPLGWLAIGVVLGAILGGIPVRRELERTRTELVAARAKKPKAEARSEQGARFLPFGLGAPREVAKPEDAPAHDTGKDAPDGPEIVAVPAPPQTPEERRRQFSMAVDAQRVRIAQNRAALVEESDLGDAQLQHFDAIVADLNADLVEYSDLFVDMALDQENVSSADMLGVTHDVTGVLADSQKSLDELLGSPAAPDDEARQIWNYIDLETFRPAVEELGAQQGVIAP